MTSVAEPLVETASPAPPLEFKALLPYEPESAGKARGLVEGALRSWELDALIDTAVLITSELMTNAIQTACQRLITLAIARTDGSLIRISVTDGSCYPPVFIDSGPANAAQVPPRGRGLLVVDRLSKRWGLEVAARGKTVWAELHVGRRSR
ncbi:ATP-binding protein [Kitasatospora sp. NPDC059800]|uniref:ATP-binding protein n=1 Tax=Kitasatospora sp. NPDC059800 TaxID=3346951 RepID=UPI0036677F7E